jgi:hypothetical protein
MRGRTALALLLSLMALAGCGSEEDDAPGAGTTPTAPAATTADEPDYGY